MDKVHHPPPTSSRILFPSYPVLCAATLAAQNPSIPTLDQYADQLDNLSVMLKRRTKKLSSSAKDKSIRVTNGEDILELEVGFLEQRLVLENWRMAAKSLARFRENEEGEVRDWKEVLEMLREELERLREKLDSL
ncbi:MAG: hypothetical protein Q9226_004529 [Calogaya cf. arnoldii]